MTGDNDVDWGPIELLAERVLEQGAALELDDETRALLHAGAREVGLRAEDAADALRSASTATTLLREIRRRMEDGNERLTKTRVRAWRLQEQGDYAGARKLLEDLLAVEVVPFYREQAAIELENVATLEAVFSTGRVEADFHPWGQLRALALRVQQGHPLELRDDLRAFLRQTAPSVAISDAEVASALVNVEGAKALLGKMLERIQDGKQRISRALDRMMACREAGDREGALQALRDVLAVEVVPKYRQMAQENLDRYDEPPPAL